ncbi:MAG: hypothetical protein JXA52_10340 [Planctomycetes bacterium]|nr:hypothetical protein [Planctomycetota bacterium]
MNAGHKNNSVLPSFLPWLALLMLLCWLVYTFFVPISGGWTVSIFMNTVFVVTGAGLSFLCRIFKKNRSLLCFFAFVLWHIVLIFTVYNWVIAPDKYLDGDWRWKEGSVDHFVDMPVISKDFSGLITERKIDYIFRQYHSHDLQVFISGHISRQNLQKFLQNNHLFTSGECGEEGLAELSFLLKFTGGDGAKLNAVFNDKDYYAYGKLSSAVDTSFQIWFHELDGHFVLYVEVDSSKQ